MSGLNQSVADILLKVLLTERILERFERWRRAASDAQWDVVDERFVD